ncbi:MAG: response regulator transcription factor [Saprospiraceae bacterium]|nr:response regulator transcription factor [Saprospiraceae bacterium]
MPSGSKILVVEDDLNLGFLLMEFLEGAGYQVKWCRDALAGLAQFKKQRVDLCILDVMMPGMDGFSLAKHIFESDHRTPFLFLTARLLKEDRLKGYQLGAEDYITKPFDEDELLCKIKVILRRQKHALKKQLPAQFQLGEFLFDAQRQELIRNGELQRITEKETAVLQLLCQHKNQILRRDEAVEQIYGKNDYFLGRSFDVFICRLRKLLTPDPNISIENVFKVGFILNVKEGKGTTSNL